MADQARGQWNNWQPQISPQTEAMAQGAAQAGTMQGYHDLEGSRDPYTAQLGTALRMGMTPNRSPGLQDIAALQGRGTYATGQPAANALDSGMPRMQETPGQEGLGHGNLTYVNPPWMYGSQAGPSGAAGRAAQPDMTIPPMSPADQARMAHNRLMATPEGQQQAYNFAYGRQGERENYRNAQAEGGFGIGITPQGVMRPPASTNAASWQNAEQGMQVGPGGQLTANPELAARFLDHAAMQGSPTLGIPASPPLGQNTLPLDARKMMVMAKAKGISPPQAQMESNLLTGGRVSPELMAGAGIQGIPQMMGEQARAKAVSDAQAAHNASQEKIAAGNNAAHIAGIKIMTEEGGRNQQEKERRDLYNLGQDQKKQAAYDVWFAGPGKDSTPVQQDQYKQYLNTISLYQHLPEVGLPSTVSGTSTPAGIAAPAVNPGTQQSPAGGQTTGGLVSPPVVEHPLTWPQTIGIGAGAAAAAGAIGYGASKVVPPYIPGTVAHAARETAEAGKVATMNEARAKVGLPPFSPRGQGVAPPSGASYAAEQHYGPQVGELPPNRYAPYQGADANEAIRAATQPVSPEAVAAAEHYGRSPASYTVGGEPMPVMSSEQAVAPGIRPPMPAAVAPEAMAEGAARVPGAEGVMADMPGYAGGAVSSGLKTAGRSASKGAASRLGSVALETLGGGPGGIANPALAADLYGMAQNNRRVQYGSQPLPNQADYARLQQRWGLKPDQVMALMREHQNWVSSGAHVPPNAVDYIELKMQRMLDRATQPERWAGVPQILPPGKNGY